MTSLTLRNAGVCLFVFPINISLLRHFESFCLHLPYYVIRVAIDAFLSPQLSYFKYEWIWLFTKGIYIWWNHSPKKYTWTYLVILRYFKYFVDRFIQKYINFLLIFSLLFSSESPIFGYWIWSVDDNRDTYEVWHIWRSFK